MKRSISTVSLFAVTQTTTKLTSCSINCLCIQYFIFVKRLNVNSYDQIPFKQGTEINKETALHGTLTRKTGKERESGFKKGLNILKFSS